ncbi:MAG: hypothetical protein IT275_02320 [Chitinophagales bacterium]|nr:hypothetical protein [Chitinophagales bacterium]HMV14951.1 hypothetical protein [Chitinophagales bacterium]HMW13019.1 hypothetical protein [Chitinophagales bacterium]HMX60737.1 hypothetical protein [Chitinophagales bacterium]HMY23046.1 hypothetical protein [Chitinophagales bacterium]
MKTITVSVPDEKVASLEAFLYQSNIKIIKEKEDLLELRILEIEMEAAEPETPINTAAIEQALDEEIWKLHRFGE